MVLMIVINDTTPQRNNISTILPFTYAYLHLIQTIYFTIFFPNDFHASSYPPSIFVVYFLFLIYHKEEKTATLSVRFFTLAGGSNCPKCSTDAPFCDFQKRHTLLEELLPDAEAVIEDSAATFAVTNDRFEGRLRPSREVKQ
ncbi:hypothetical protein TNIN_111971 [Trichonephila inaurata madagascariensis]|uniref:Uncharacterized protein n=1 Tax=Trichonephila inaurata madagascariensis TaxID=2747483 RepID=A0A8X7BYF2_9ARAC|nr:hypothetical protein TNIN_111971 [Trichonephila inaurata madagascariensis]